MTIFCGCLSQQKFGSRTYIEKNEFLFKISIQDNILIILSWITVNSFHNFRILDKYFGV